MKRALIYFLAFMGGGLFGLMILGHVPDSLSFLNHGVLNFPIYGAVGFSICAISYKQYILLLLLPLIAVVMSLLALFIIFPGG